MKEYAWFAITLNMCIPRKIFFIIITSLLNSGFNQFALNQMTHLYYTFIFHLSLHILLSYVFIASAFIPDVIPLGCKNTIRRVYQFVVVFFTETKFISKFIGFS